MNNNEPEIKMFGGPATALIPAVVVVGVLLWLSLAERASISSFWVGGWAAIIVGLLLTKTPRAFAESITRGLTDQTGAVIILAYLFAGVFGKLLAEGGLVNGLLWFGVESGVQGAFYVVLAFLLSCIFAAGTGSSVGAVLALVPVLYPTGVALGGDPVMLAVGILAGGAFGDNIAPISDTTITSAYTAKAEMGAVVKARLPLSLSSAAVTIIVLAIFGGGSDAIPSSIDVNASPWGLLMIIPFFVVIVLAMRGQRIVVSLIWGTLAAIVIGLFTQLLAPGDIFSIPAERGQSSGLVEDGISNITGAIVLVLFILALAQVLTDSGIMNNILTRLERHAARGVRSAELMISGITLLFTVPLGANAPAILLVGPTIGQPLGADHKLAPSRIANLMDCAANTVFYMLPWHNAVIIWYATLVITVEQYDLPLPSIASAFLNPYAWALLVVLLISIITGWNRRYVSPSESPVR
ncbi:sodium:proton antiporter [Pistricoccus aurantiacus]|uniref:Sodium:proton antiporter n=1 Tax=Pistricoccus aurantiacus TaxID=1883414 RepID=A0A5B8SUK7_9GAMM|nr:Na+/H+ antiporter NhaC family protein [Pistricoccus aurantiacus]QEA40639.1 sodium:proton antiporter [Pistricoccus aurantiacus]